MGGFTLSERDVAGIQTVVDRCREVGDEPISSAVRALCQVLETDQVSVAGFCASADPRRASGLTDRDRFILTLLRPHLADHHARWLRAHPPTVPLTRRQRGAEPRAGRLHQRPDRSSAEPLRGDRPEPPATTSTNGWAWGRRAGLPP